MIDYMLLAPVCTDKLRRTGTLTDLVRDIPGILFSNCIQPLHILNQFLKRGRKDAGMSGGAEWKPFNVPQEEYEFLVEDLVSYPDRNYYYSEPPAEISEFDQWWQWVFNQPKQKRK